MPQRSEHKLHQLLAEARPALEAALAEAESELADLDRRRAELEELIARAKAALGAIEPDAGVGPPAPSRRLTLHEAMQLVLTENENRWTTVHDLARVINDRSLYEKRDHTWVDPSQIHARANKYPALFEKDGPRVRLK
jgi:hypothetical protein